MSKQIDETSEPKIRMPLLRKGIQWLWIIIFSVLCYHFFVNPHMLNAVLDKIAEATSLQPMFVKVLIAFSLFLFAFMSFVFIVYSNGEAKITVHAKDASHHDSSDDRAKD